jgi:diadenosine tetraphosphate (Ap4A) HIT family hydrolase
MDEYPIRPGHLLVFPIEHIPDVLELAPERLTALMVLARRLSAALKCTYQVERIALFTAGKAIGEHGHLHLLPLADGLKKTFAGLSERERPCVDRATLMSEGMRILSSAKLGA